jgi:4-hydroxy-3-methylbut-2-en-1-yl diphosphate synthase IspG/GcpE
MPIDLTAEDVERLLKPETESAAFFAALGRRAKQLHSTAPLVYDITFKLEQDLSRATITIQLVKGSTTNSGESLLQLTLGDAKEISQGKTQWVIVDWKLE